MRMYRSVLKMVLVLGLVAGITSPAGAFLGNKFEKEVEKETNAVKLVREVQRGGYDVVTTEELKKWNRYSEGFYSCQSGSVIKIQRLRR